MRKLLMTGIAALALLATPALAQTGQTQPTTPMKTAPPPAGAQPMPAKPAPAMPAPAKTEVMKPASTGKAQMLDINMATKEQLQALKGVGPVRAEAIIKGRPYKGKDELLQKKILPQNVYDDVKASIIARQH